MKKFHKENRYLFSECWERIKNKTNIENYSQLAEIIGLSKSNVTKRKDENIFPIEWAFLVGRKFQLSTEWILTGEEQKKTDNTEINPLLIDVNEWLNEEEKHKDTEFRILFRRQMIRAFFDYEAWVKKRKMPLGDVAENPITKVA